MAFGVNMERAAAEYTWPANALASLTPSGRKQRCSSMMRQAVIDLPKTRGQEHAQGDEIVAVLRLQRRETQVMGGLALHV